MEPSTPISKPDLLASADKLSYHDRAHLASRIGHAQKGSKGLETLIKDLRTHPAPVLPEIEKDDAVADLLPVQKRDTAKFYHEEQLALFAAAAAKDISTLRDELNQPSVMFKRLVCSAIARDDLDDDWLASKILSSSSKVKRDIISACVAEHRVAVLNRVIVQIAKEHDANLIVPKALHGCSSQIVAELLPKFIKSPRIGWSRIVRFHSAVILDMMQTELAECNIYKRDQVWNKWNTLLTPSPVKEFVTHTGQGLNILRLWEKFPIVEQLRSLNTGETELPEAATRRQLPSMITTHLNYYFRHHLDVIMPIFINGVRENHHGYLIASPVFPGLLTNGLVPFSKHLEYIKRVISLSTPKSFWTWGGVDRDVMRSLHVSILSPSEIVQLVDTIQPWMETMKRAQDQPSYLDSLRDNALELINRIYSQMGEIADQAFSTHFLQAQGGKRHLPVAEFEAKKAEIVAKRDALNDKLLAKIENDTIHCLDKLFPIYADTWRGKAPVKASDIIRLGDVFLPQYPSRTINAPQFVHVLMHLFKLLKPGFLDMTQAKAPPKMDHNYTQAAEYLIKFAFRMMETIAAMTSSEKAKAFAALYQTGKSPAMIAYAKEQLAVVHEYFLKWFKQNQVTNVEGMKALFGLAPSGESARDVFPEHLPEQLQKNAFAAMDATTWTALITTDASIVTSMLEAVPLPLCQKVVEALLEDKKLGKDEKDLLLPFLRVDDPKNRKLFEKTANANNVADRQFALKAMITSTFRINKSSETLLTLKFLRQKIKNEAMEQRVFVFSKLSEGLPSGDDWAVLLPKDHAKPQEFFDVYYQLLQDFLEAPDASEGPKESNWGDDSTPTVVDTYPITGFFSALKSSANSRAIETRNLAFLEFAVELGWRQDMHSMGKSSAASSLTISVPKAGWKGALMSVAELTTIVDKVVSLYEKYLTDDVPDWKDNSQYFADLFILAHRRWFEVPILKERAFHFMAILKSTPQTATYGVAAGYFNRLENLLQQSPGGVYSTHPVVAPLAKDMWQYVLAGQHYTSRWWKAMAKREKGLTGRAKHEAREKFVDELLAAQPSAIFIPVVWRTLWNRRTNKLDSYIGALQSFRGPSFKSADLRKLAAKNTPARKVVPPRGRIVRRRGAPVVAWGGRGGSYGNAAVMAEEETKMQAALKKMPADLADHRDLFTLQPMYGLHKLLPRQSAALGEQYRRMIFNVDRPMPERVAAAVRYTLQPAISYTEMVKFIQARDSQFQEEMKVYKEKTAAGESVSEPRPFPTLLLESVIKGLMSNDEPGAPLGFLLTPQFLGSDLARVAVFAVSRVVPFMPPGSLSKVLKLMLTGKRRLALKVTAFKEIIRMLMKEPSKEHLEIIKHEWNRSELHRDVRIVILTMALHALGLGVPEQEDIAWYILESPVAEDFAKRITNATTRAEIATAILGAKPFGRSGVSIAKNQIINARLLPHLSSLQKVQVPTEHFTRYSKLVLRVAQTATDLDIRFIALAALIIWNSEDDEHPEAHELQKFLVDFNHPVFASEKRSDIARYNEQWRVLSGSLLDFCHMRGTSVTNPAAPQLVIDVMAKITAYVAGLPMKERKNRAMVYTNVSGLLSAIDSRRCVNHAHYPRSDELALLDTIQANLPGYFWSTITDRKITQVIALYDVPASFKQFYEELFSACVGDGSHVTFATSKLTEMVTGVQSRQHMEITSIGFEIVDRELQAKTVNGAIQFSFSWAILEALNKLWHTSYFDTDRAISFFRRATKFASEGALPAHITDLPASLQRLARDIVYRMCPWDTVTKTRTLTPDACKVFQSLLLPLINKTERAAMNSTEAAIYYQTVVLLLKDNADSVVQAINEEQLHALLHLVLVDSLGHLNSSAGNKAAASIFNSIATRLKDTQGQTRLCSFVEKIMSLSLSGQPVYEPKDYNRLSLDIALEIVSSYPFFVQNNTRVFYQFANWCIASFLLDSSSLNPLTTLSSVVRGAFTNKELFTGRNKDVWTSGPLCEIISAFIAASTISEPHPFSETLLSVTSFKSQYQLVCQQTALSLLLHYGSTYRELTNNDTVIEWRLEFVALLEKLCESPFAKIKQSALLQEVALPATKNDSAPKRK